MGPPRAWVGTLKSCRVAVLVVVGAGLVPGARWFRCRELSIELGGWALLRIVRGIRGRAEGY
ncbi:hypothetical protein GCM10009864_82940 [Streptomyces lunalinharesii]|uniref:Uncharacterized protein n=1 Tax=Streptomyces lunalinharesii TaxID=333384 RepID=A0ABN3TAP8_9ACTN